MRLPLRNDRFAFLRAGEEIDPFDLNIGKHKGLERTIGCVQRTLCFRRVPLAGRRARVRTQLGHPFIIPNRVDAPSLAKDPTSEPGKNENHQREQNYDKDDRPEDTPRVKMVARSNNSGDRRCKP